MHAHPPALRTRGLVYAPSSVILIIWTGSSGQSSERENIKTRTDICCQAWTPAFVVCTWEIFSMRSYLLHI